MWMMKLHHPNNTDTKSKTLLMTGAHHSRELSSIQMPLYTLLSVLQGYAKEQSCRGGNFSSCADSEKIDKLVEQIKYNDMFVLPMINVDGCHAIMEHYNKTGELMFKRKNADRRFEGDANCPEWLQGVDINRNYGYNFGNTNGPCSESFPGPHAFSEPESQAMRAMLQKYQDKIAFVYNFHATGPMYIWPYNSEINNELSRSNPEAQKIFNEIWENATFPASTISGNAVKTVGYVADGEANDYILKAFNIPSVSPELGNDNIFASNFFLPYKFLAREIMRDNYPWVFHTI